MGCSSANQMDYKSTFKNLINYNEKEITLHFSEAFGISIEYLLNKTPVLLGALWSVTDKDTDKFTLNLLESYENKKGWIDLVSCLLKTRE